MPSQTTKHSAVLEAIRRTPSVAELVEEHGSHFAHELELEVIVYGRNYAGKKVGPYVRLLTYEPGEEVIHEDDVGSNVFYVLVGGTLDVHVRTTGTADPNDIGAKIAELKPDTSFGEMAILAGVPRNATVVVPPNGSADVLEFSRPALRLLRKLERFGTHLDRTYRDHGLGRTLEDLRQAAGEEVDRDLLAELRPFTRFAVYGKNHVLAQEGTPVTHLLMIKNGWVRRVGGANFDPSHTQVAIGADDDAGVDFLGSGNWLGLNALGDEANRARAENAEAQSLVWRYTATTLARTEVIEIPLADLLERPHILRRVRQAFDKFSVADDNPNVSTSRDSKDALLVVEREITTGVVDGTNLLVMDMDLCVRCGNCSLACHKVHGQSRLLRRGIHIERPRAADLPANAWTPKLSFINPTQHVLAPSVCIHCQDPECLTGCPTGAIGWKASGEIAIHADTCIGCGDCATQCPYNAISMVPRGGGSNSKGGSKSKDGSKGRDGSGGKGAPGKDAAGGRGGTPASAETSALMRVADKLRVRLRLSPSPLPAPVTETENLLAVKCNLCHDTPLNPKGATREAYSCQENCPTGALVRVNPRTYFSEVNRTLGVVFRDSTHAVGRNIHKRDTPARLLHVGGALATVALTIATVYGLVRYGFDTPLVAASVLSPWLTMRWLTGFVGLFGVAAVMTYPLRKQVYRRRAGALRYWLIAHVYAGAIAGLVLLLHGGTHTGGLLTTSLMISFDLVIFSGLFGLLTYIVAPRVMTSIEGEPLLIEDLQARRAELRASLAAAVAESPAELREVIGRDVRKRFFTLSYLLRHYLRREPLTAMLADARGEYEPIAARFTDAPTRRLLIDAVETTVTLRRVESLIYLHALLKAWVAPHVVSTALMLALMVVHIIQVFFFHVR